jgi:hypothetical protein
MRNSSVKKTSWPEVVGIMAPVAADKIHADRPDVIVELFPVSVAGTMPPGYDANVSASTSMSTMSHTRLSSASLHIARSLDRSIIHRQLKP